MTTNVQHIRWQCFPSEPVGMRGQFNDHFLEAAFDEGSRFRQPSDPLFGFPVWDILDLFTYGA